MTTTSIPQRRSLTRLAFAGYFMVGIAGILFAPLLPSIIAEFELSLTAAGLLFPALSFGGLLGGLAAGPFVDRHGIKPVVAASLSITVVGFLASAAASRWVAVLAGLALIGLGQRALGTSLNTLVVKANPDQSAKYLNYLHGLYGAGSLIAPLIVGAVLLAQGSWRLIFVAPAALWLLFLIAVLRQSFPPHQSAAVKAPGSRAKLLAGPTLVALLLVAFCYNGIAFSILGWVKTFLDLAGDVHPYLSTSMISIFYAALTLGRFACGLVARRLGYAATILACAGGTALAYPLVAWSWAPALLIPGIFLCGLFLSGLYPTALAIATETFKERAGTVTGVLTTAMTAGSMLPPWWTGAIAEATSFQTAMLANSVLVCLLVAAAVALVKRSRIPAPGAQRSVAG